MFSPEKPQSKPYENLGDLLFSFHFEVDYLDRQANRLSSRSPDTYNEALRKKGEIVMKLHSTIVDFKAEGNQVPDEVEEATAIWSYRARQCLPDNYFGLSVLLSGIDSDGLYTPTELAELAAKYSPAI